MQLYVYYPFTPKMTQQGNQPVQLERGKKYPIIKTEANGVRIRCPNGREPFVWDDEVSSYASIESGHEK